eukprot:3062404-Rhodomonas_salina.1
MQYYTIRQSTLMCQAGVPPMQPCPYQHHDTPQDRYQRRGRRHLDQSASPISRRSHRLVMLNGLQGTRVVRE